MPAEEAFRGGEEVGEEAGEEADGEAEDRRERAGKHRNLVSKLLCSCPFAEATMGIFGLLLH